MNVVLFGWDGAEARKLPMLWGYSVSWGEDLSGTASGTTYHAYSAPVPSGYVYVLQALFVRDITRAVTAIWVEVVKSDGIQVRIAERFSVSTGQSVIYNGEICLAAGDRVHIEVAGTASGDDIRSRLCGYKMRIDQ